MSMQPSTGDIADTIRKELQAEYARSGKAFQEKDANTLMQMITPDFTQKMLDGQVISYEQIVPALQEWFRALKEVTHYEVKIEDLTLQGPDAVAVVRENVSTTFADPEGGSHQSVQTNTSRVVWTQTPSGWRIRQTEYLTANTLIDGVALTP
jgi:ketosteroid isomerase-like protein